MSDASHQFTIIKNAPPPSPRSACLGRPAIYPFAKMEPGDAFDVALVKPKSKWGQHPEQATMTRTGRYWAKKLGAKFVTRKIASDLMRVWRVS